MKIVNLKLSIENYKGGGFIRRLITNIRGVTLVEVLLAVTISGIIGAVVVTVHLAQERVYAGEDAFINMYRNTRTVIDKVTITLRMAGYDPTGSASFDPGISYANSDSMVIVIDYDGDGVLDGDETVVYTSHTFASLGIDSLRFAYLDRNHVSLATPVDTLPDINSVAVTVVVRRYEGLPGRHRYELSREVKLRN
ncbi:hypothetical protein CH333_02850 [candidate division WOR-3 bacterium JGI_Cruoil_03_44_89]|uniref:Prepilin-type N-terminal cleavage/methylation domain-containing protein n=1 Tax=candidate division WOR-3 bacterium JGI_Cruoil_03_44_89 TaxID=1973748 RepID=A0A235BWW4_UNCW3|nr:MAG: hypothetical protein CH333_02850 [candidate division WOR-3 bacterium JGI_Cruoil_03_44_89]